MKQGHPHSLKCSRTFMVSAPQDQAHGRPTKAGWRSGQMNLEMEVWEWWGGVKQGDKPSLWGNAGKGGGKGGVWRKGLLGWERGTTMGLGSQNLGLWG